MGIFNPQTPEEKQKHDTLMQIMGGMGVGMLQGNPSGDALRQGLLGGAGAAIGRQQSLLDQPYKEMELQLKQAQARQAQMAIEAQTQANNRYNLAMGGAGGGGGQPPMAPGGFDPARASPQELERYALWISGGDPTVYAQLMSQYRQINPALEGSMSGARADAANASDLRYKPVIEGATVTARGEAERPFKEEDSNRAVVQAGNTVTAQETARLPFATLDQQREIEAALNKSGLAIGEGGTIIPLPGYAESAAVEPATRARAEAEVKAEVEAGGKRNNELASIEEQLLVVKDGLDVVTEFDTSRSWSPDTGSALDPFIVGIGSVLNAINPTSVDLLSTGARKRINEITQRLSEPIFRDKLLGSNPTDGERAFIEGLKGLSGLSTAEALRKLQELQGFLEGRRTRLQEQGGVSPAGAPTGSPATTTTGGGSGGNRIRLDPSYLD